MIKRLQLFRHFHAIDLHGCIRFSIGLFGLNNKGQMLNQFLQHGRWITHFTIINIETVIKQP